MRRVKYRLLTRQGVSVSKFDGRPILKIQPKTLARLAQEALRDVSFLLRPAHQRQVAAILKDPKASANDQFVALTLLENSTVSAQFELPFCQDTGTATVVAWKGQQVWTGTDDTRWLARGIRRTYIRENLRYSQTVALDMVREKNSGDNLPAQIDIYAAPGLEYKFLFMAKGGGSANKTFLYQETKALLNPASLKKFLIDKMKSLGTAACPPYHIAFVIGGTSAEACLKTVKLASTGYYDSLPTSGDKHGRAFRDLRSEKELLEAARQSGFGAQFGGRHFAHDVRVIRLPRHGASCPVGLGVSCCADRNILAKIDRGGVWLEELERRPEKLIPAESRGSKAGQAVRIDLDRPMKEIQAELSKHPVATRLSLSGRVIVARDIAHARFKQRLDSGKGLPQYLKDHPVLYAGPAKTPPGKPSGSLGPTTAGRMDSYVDLFQKQGASLVMIAKGDRSPCVAEACRRHGGFYLGALGGPAAILAEKCVKKVKLIEYPELGMEAVYAVDVVGFPAFILIDDKGNDFYRQLSLGAPR
jgi:fumarate hydratase class I